MRLFYRLGLLFVLLWPQTVAPLTPDPPHVREIHVLKSDEGDTKLILRFPLVLAYANELSGHDGTSDLVAPFVLNSKVPEGPQAWRLDSTALLDDYDAFADFLLRDYRFSVNGKVVAVDTPEFVVIDNHDPENVDVNICLGLMSTLAMLSLCTSDYPDRPKISETLIVMSLYLGDVMPTDALKIELLAKPFKTGGEAGFETQITDYRSAASQTVSQTANRTHVIKGVVFDPVVLGNPGGFPSQRRRYGMVLLLVLAGGFMVYRRRVSRAEPRQNKA